MLFHYRGEILYYGDRGETIGAHYDVDAASIESAKPLLEERLVHDLALTTNGSTWFRISRDGVEIVAYQLTSH